MQLRSEESLSEDGGCVGLQVLMCGGYRCYCGPGDKSLLSKTISVRSTKLLCQRQEFFARYLCSIGISKFSFYNFHLAVYHLSAVTAATYRCSSSNTSMRLGTLVRQISEQNPGGNSRFYGPTTPAIRYPLCHFDATLCYRYTPVLNTE